MLKIINRIVIVIAAISIIAVIFFLAFSERELGGQSIRPNAGHFDEFDDNRN